MVQMHTKAFISTQEDVYAYSSVHQSEAILKKDSEKQQTGESIRRKNLSIKELASLLGVHVDNVRRVAQSGLIPFTQQGSAYQFDWAKVRWAMRERANHMPFRRKGQASAPGGRGRPRAANPPRR
jgi:excisionase family DNA binding protein